MYQVVQFFQIFNIDSYAFFPSSKVTSKVLKRKFPTIIKIDPPPSASPPIANLAYNSYDNKSLLLLIKLTTFQLPPLKFLPLYTTTIMNT